MRSRRAVRATAAALLLAGAALAADGLWIPAKAQVAQVLLERAWRQAATGGEAPRAWPWMDTRPVARLVVPRLGVEQIVLAGTSGEALAFGPGRVEDAEVLALAGHRDTHFAFLRDVRAGDEVLVETIDGERRFRVETTRIVDRGDVSVLDGSSDELRLITCYPFDALTPGDERFVVEASMREPGSRSEASEGRRLRLQLGDSSPGPQSVVVSKDARQSQRRTGRRPRSPRRA